MRHIPGREIFKFGHFFIITSKSYYNTKVLVTFLFNKCELFTRLKQFCVLTICFDVQNSASVFPLHAVMWSGRSTRSVIVIKLKQLSNHELKKFSLINASYIIANYWSLLYNYSRFLWWQRGTYNSCIIYTKDGLSVYKFIHRHKCQLEINSH